MGGRGQIEGQDQQRLPRLLNRVSANKKRRALRRAVFLSDRGFAYAAGAFGVRLRELR